MFSGWWLGENDNRASRPYVSPERWHQELQSAGFTGADVTAFDLKPPYHISASYISRPVDHTHISQEIWLLTRNSKPCQWAKCIESLFIEKGYTTHWSTLTQAPPKGKFIISLLDPGNSPILELPEDIYHDFQHYIEQVQDCQILWVTQSTSLACSDATSGLIHGFARTLRAELLLDVSILEVPTWDMDSARALIQVCEKIRRSRIHSVPDPEYEFAFDEGEIKVGRYHWTPLAEQLKSQPCANMARKLNLTAYGLLDTLQWVEKEPCSLGAEQIEVKMEYIGINFKVHMSFRLADVAC